MPTGDLILVRVVALGVVGLMNVQFAVKDGEIYVIEVNPRASRTVPFVAKATDSAIAFRWTRSLSAAGTANTYQLFIYSREDEDGSEILVPIFSSEVTDTVLLLDAAALGLVIVRWS